MLCYMQLYTLLIIECHSHYRLKKLVNVLQFHTGKQV